MTLYLGKVMRIPLSLNQSRRITSFMSISDDLESVTDYCADLITHRKRLFDDKHELSEATEKELINMIISLQHCETPSMIGISTVTEKPTNSFLLG